MIDTRAYRESRALHTKVLDWCEAGLNVPGLEPERRAKIVEIRQAVSDRICSAKPHQTHQLAPSNSLAWQELAWLQGDARITDLDRSG